MTPDPSQDDQPSQQHQLSPTFPSEQAASTVLSEHLPSPSLSALSIAADHLGQKDTPPATSSRESSSPPSPRLQPSRPLPGSSGISSLANSTGEHGFRPLPVADVVGSNSTSSITEPPEPLTNTVPFEAQSLMQMLSMVGSRLMEADQLGLIDARDTEEATSTGEDEKDGQGQGRDKDDASVSHPGLPRDLSSSRSLASGSPLPRFSQRRPGIMSALLDEDPTPKGGSTPLGASLYGGQSASRPQSLKTSRIPSQARASPIVGKGSDTSDVSSDESADAEQDRESFAAIPATMMSSLHSLSAPPPPSASSHVMSSESRRKQLTLKLQNIFSLPLTEEVQSCHACWLYRSVLLQGHVYLTSGHVLFYAYLPSREDRVVKAGAIKKRTQKTYRFSRHWAVLRGRALSWYDSSRDPYFPQDHIDLRDVLAVASVPKQQNQFRVHTPSRVFVFEVDSTSSRDDWVDALQKAVFRAQNEGDSVKISIPLEAIVDVENTISVGVGEQAMVCLQVVDATAANFALDEYLFLRFDRQEDFVKALRECVEQHAASTSSRTLQATSTIQDSTGGVQRLLADAMSSSGRGDIPSLPAFNPRTGSHICAADEALGAPGSSASPASDGPQDVARAITIPSQHMTQSQSAEDLLLSATPRATNMILSGTLKAPDAIRWGYPPSPPSRHPPPGFDNIQKEASQPWPIPNWVKDASGRFLPSEKARNTLTSLLQARRRPLRPVSEIWSSRPVAPPSAGQLEPYDTDTLENLSISQSSSFSLLETPQPDEVEKREKMKHHFSHAFSLPTQDEMIYDQDACLYRVLPVAGRLFISSQHLCFRSSSLATKTLGRTKMILPFQEIVSCVVHPAFRFGWHGLVAMVRGHEEIFLEFNSRDKRDLCLRHIEERIEAKFSPVAARSSVEAAARQARQDALVLTDLTAKTRELTLGESVSSLTSSSSGSELQQDGSLLSFQPKQSMHFTILTIGSRGDVQPFLALSKGLIADGHRVRMATHAEFGPWIQQHGVDFVEIGGDPAELMKICVENGTFTLSFLREGVTKFRDWLDELLVSCWHACQGTDVIIESPNAIAGIHISEALQVPCFRAFTMPWSRTRAYPQAFAVPNKKAGGNYNYMTYVIFDQVLWTASAGQINRWRTSCLGLQSTSLDKLEQHKTPFLYNFSPSLVPKPLDWYDWIHVTGFWFLDHPENSASKAWTPPEELSAFLARARERCKKLVYIGWGSITVPDAAATTRCVIEAVKKSNVCAVLSKGWSDRLTKKGADEGVAIASEASLLSEDVFQVRSVPHDWLFPQMDAACHHGGAGTLGASLRAGIPTIVKPFFGDQFFWGQQVESLGVGSCVRDLTIDALASALVQATQNTRQIAKARELGRQIRAENGVAEAIRAIYADLDYARSLIKKGIQTSYGSQTAVARSRARSASTSASSPSNLSSPSGARALSPAAAALSPARGHFAAGPNRSRANSGQTTSDEWSVVSGSEEDEERRAALAE